MKKEKTKIVALPIAAPKWAKCMAFDRDGRLWFHGGKVNMGFSVWFSWDGMFKSDLCLAVPKPCSNPDWWKTLSKVDASSGVVNLYLEAPIWAKWMAFDANGSLWFYKIRPVDGHRERWMIGRPWDDWTKSDLAIHVPESCSNPDWWTKTLRKI